MSDIQEHKRVQDSRLTPLQVALTDDDGDAVDLTGYTATFYLYDTDGNAIVEGGTCTIPTPTSGYVNYAWTAEAVANPGEYWGYFRVYVTGSPTVYDVYPPDRQLQIIITEGS